MLSSAMSSQSKNGVRSGHGSGGPRTSDYRSRKSSTGTTTGATSGSGTSTTTTAPVPQLSCELCRERKVKCDKLDPCTTCVAANVQCAPIYRPRLPRGRHAARSHGGATTAATATKTSEDAFRTKPKPAVASSAAASSTAGPSTAAVPTPGRPASTPTPAPTMLDTDLDVRGNVGVRGVKVSVPMTSKSASLAPSPSSAAASAGSTQVPWIPQHHASSSMQEDLDSNIAGGAGPPTAGLSSDHRSFTLDLNEFDDLAYNMPSWLPPYDDFVDHMASGSSSLTPSSTIAADAMITDGYGHDPLNDQQFDLFDFLPSTQAAPLSFPNESAGNLGLAGDHPSLDTSRLQQQTKLYGVFLDQVDTVVKILHVPSLTLFMKHNEPYLAYPRGHPAPAALRSAVLYSAACTMSEDRVHALFDTSKSEFVNKMREECEETLHRAGILHQQDVTCLQALVLYLVGRRSEGHRKLAWTLTSIGIRLAMGMSLHLGHRSLDDHQLSFYDRQIRSRLWLALCELDFQASLDYDTKPLVALQDISGALHKTKNLCDDDFTVDTPEESFQSSEDLTHSTLALITYNSQIARRLLKWSRPQRNPCIEEAMPTPPPSRTASRHSSLSDCSDDSNECNRIVTTFERKVFTLLRFCDPDDSEYAWFTWHSTQILVSLVRLERLGSAGPDVNAVEAFQQACSGLKPSTSEEMKLALRILERTHQVYTSAHCERFRWSLAFPWPALGVAVSQCYQSNDEMTTRRIWPTVENVWRQLPIDIVPADSHVLAGPLSNIMTRIRNRLNSSGKSVARIQAAGTTHIPRAQEPHNPYSHHSAFGSNVHTARSTPSTQRMPFRGSSNRQDISARWSTRDIYATSWSSDRDDVFGPSRPTRADSIIDGLFPSFV